MRRPLLACFAIALLARVGAAPAAPSRVRTPTPNPNPAVAPAGKPANDAALFQMTLPLKIDAMKLVSSWTPCTAMPGFAPGPGSGNLTATDAHSAGFCRMASVRLKKTVATASLAGKSITIQVSSQHLNVTPFTTNVSLYTLPFPASGDTLTYPRVAVGSFTGDNPTRADSNQQRAMDADHMFSLGRPVVVELRNNGQTVDKRVCTFKTTEVPGGPGPAALTCP